MFKAFRLSPVLTVLGLACSTAVEAAPILTFQAAWDVRFINPSGGAFRQGKGAFGSDSTVNGQITGTTSDVPVLKSESQVAGTATDSRGNTVLAMREFTFENCEDDNGCKLEVSGELTGELVVGNPFFDPIARVTARIEIQKKNPRIAIDPFMTTIATVETTKMNDRKVGDMVPFPPSDIFPLPFPGDTTRTPIDELLTFTEPLLLVDGTYRLIAELRTFASIVSLATGIDPDPDDSLIESIALSELYELWLLEILPDSAFDPASAAVFVAGSAGLAQSNFFSTFEVNLALVPEPTTLALLGLGIAGLGFARRRLH